MEVACVSGRKADPTELQTSVDIDQDDDDDEEEEEEEEFT